MVEGLKTISQNFIDLDKVKSYKDLTKEIHTFEEKKEALNNIINSILPNKKTLLFIIDELDRCKPDYAINMIEVIKHFYSNERIVFLLGTNNLQLSYTISNYYGNKFDGYGYLNKVYNLIIELGDVSVEKYIEAKIDRKESDRWYDIGLYGICEFFNFSMREINRLLNDYDIISEYMNTSYGGIYNEDYTIKYLFLPYCLGLKIGDRTELTEFFNGKGYSSFEKFVFENKGLKKILEHDYTNPINRNLSEDEKTTKLKVFLKEKYDSYFNSNKTNDWHIVENKNKFYDIFSLLSSHSNFFVED